MAAYITGISIATPDVRYDQMFVRDFMKKHVAKNRLTSLSLHQIYSQSAIENRYSVISDFSEEISEKPGLFQDHSTGELLSPTTGQRNELYMLEARKLFKKAASDVVSQAGINPEQITHVITVSCTGFYAPGPDLDVVHHLGLKYSTQRYHIGFMGCYAAFPAIRMAKTICDSDSNATVLIVAAELCTLHLKFNDDFDSLLSTSVFADGCAAAVIQAQKPASGSHLEVRNMFSTLAPGGAKDMAWTIGDHGFDMILSTYIPDIIGSNLDQVLAPVWQAGKESDVPGSITNPDDVDIWAIHPGGRAIVDKIVHGVGIGEEQVTSSRKILREYGNMSSATILFVLRDILQNADATPRQVLGLAFGPGLTIESGHFTLSKEA